MTTLLLFLDLEAETVVLNDGVSLTPDAAARAAVALLKGAAYHEPRYKPVIDTLEASCGPLNRHDQARGRRSRFCSRQRRT